MLDLRTELRRIARMGRRRMITIKHPRKGGKGGIGFDASAVPAMARLALQIDRHVAEHILAILCPADDFPAGSNAGAYAHAEMDVDDVAALSAAGEGFRQHGHVGAIVDVDGKPQPLGQHGADGHLLPAVMEEAGGVQNHPLFPIDRADRSQADARYRFLGQAEPLECIQQRPGDSVHRFLRAMPGMQREPDGLERIQIRPAQQHAHLRPRQLHTGQDARRASDAVPHGLAPAAGIRLAYRHDQAVLLQAAREPVHRAGGKPGQILHLLTRHRPPGAQQRQQGPFVVIELLEEGREGRHGCAPFGVGRWLWQGASACSLSMTLSTYSHFGNKSIL